MAVDQKSITKTVVGLLFRRDEEGLRQTELLYGAGMLSLAVNITGSRETAEEIRNDALYTFLEDLERIWSLRDVIPDPSDGLSEEETSGYHGLS